MRPDLKWSGFLLLLSSGGIVIVLIFASSAKDKAQFPLVFTAAIWSFDRFMRREAARMYNRADRDGKNGLRCVG
jgi:hypothetical protein